MTMTMMSNHLARPLCSFSELVLVKEFGCLKGQKIIRKCRRKCAPQVVLVVKNPPADTGDVGDTCLIPGSRRSSGVGNGDPLQCSCLENFSGQKSLVGYSSWSCKVGHNWASEYTYVWDEIGEKRTIQEATNRARGAWLSLSASFILATS